MQFKLSAPLNQLLYGEPTFPVHKDDVPMPCSSRAVHHERVPRMDAKAHHRRAGVRVGEERSDRIGYAVAVEIQPVSIAVEVLSGAREATRNIHRQDRGAGLSGLRVGFGVGTGGHVRALAVARYGTAIVSKNTNPAY